MFAVFIDQEDLMICDEIKKFCLRFTAISSELVLIMGNSNPNLIFEHRN